MTINNKGKIFGLDLLVNARMLCDCNHTFSQSLLAVN